MDTTKKRKANFELLRIFSMLLIVSMHYLNYGGIITNSSGLNYYVSNSLYAMTYCGVDIFILITGWFYCTKVSKMSKALDKNITKSIFLWLKIIFYSLLIFIFYSFFKSSSLSLGILFDTFIPLSTKTYWFMSSYIALILFSPFIDVFISSLNKKSHGILVFVIIILFCIPATFFPSSWLLDEKDGFSLIWFICLYLIGAFLHRIYDHIHLKKNIFIFLYFIMCAFLVISFFSLKYLCEKYDITDRATRMYKYSSLPVFFSAVFLFLFFTQIEIKNEKYSKLICKISSATLGVYLIHNNHLMRSNLFVDILKCKYYYDSSLFIVHFLVSVFSVFTVCSIIEFIRSKLLDKVFLKIAKIITSLLFNTVTAVFSKFQPKGLRAKQC